MQRLLTPVVILRTAQQLIAIRSEHVGRTAEGRTDGQVDAQLSAGVLKRQPQARDGEWARVGESE